VQRGGGGGGRDEHGDCTATELHWRAQPSYAPRNPWPPMTPPSPIPVHIPIPIPIAHPEPDLDPASTCSPTSRPYPASGELVLSQWATPPPPVLSDGGAGHVLTSPLYAMHDAMHGVMHGAVPCTARCNARLGARPLRTSAAARHRSSRGGATSRLGAAAHTQAEQPCRADPRQGWAAAFARAETTAGVQTSPEGQRRPKSQLVLSHA
jgi:hypothetical protein